LTGAVAPRRDSRRELLIVFGIWLVVCLFEAWNGRAGVSERLFADPDDAMRLVQVRDWLAGQSWFDVTQYRLDPPHGGPMHWSRLVDIPIAAVILLARPFLGQVGAESAALIVVPLLTLGIAMLLVYRIGAKLMGGPAALLAVLATPASLGAMKQIRVMRIDHHGWQIVLALVALLAMLDKRPRRAGLVAGAAMALWLNISIEGLPFAAGVGAWFALEWLFDPATGERLKSYLGGLTVTSVALFVLTHAPATWAALPHDALNDAHLAAFAAAWLCCLVAVRSEIADRWKRLGILAAAGAVSVAAMFAVDPHCLQGPFSSLDPLVKKYWYDGVDEGRPVWQLDPKDAAAGLAQPLVGLAGALLAIRTSARGERREWIIFAYALGVLTLSGVFVIREATYASVVSLPGTAFLCDFALSRARRITTAPIRVVATAASVFIMAPAYAAPALVMPEDPRLIHAIQASDYCVHRTELEKLDNLPPTNLAAPLDITAAILASTHQRAIAGGYHRMPDAIRDVILLFMTSPDEARQILARRHIDYLVFCPQTPESVWWARHGPNGLAAMLNDNRTPDWLEPVDLHTRGLKIWHVRKEPGSTLPSA
jgi:hypothetical protein